MFIKQELLRNIKNILGDKMEWNLDERVKSAVRYNELTDTISWMTMNVLKKGNVEYQTFLTIMDKCPSCKPWIRQDDMKYEDCMIQKWNHAYEKTIAMYNNKLLDNKKTEWQY